MDNFLKWVSAPITSDEVTTWFNMNNIYVEKIELFSDFILSLTKLITDTYLGDFGDKTEATLLLNDKENREHFDWCWNKIISNFKNENINFNVDGEHKDYLMLFFHDAFYTQKNELIRESILKFFEYMFDVSSQFTKSDLDMLTEIYKKLDKNLNVVYIE